MEDLDFSTGGAAGATSKKFSKKSSKHHNLTPSKAKSRGHHANVSLPPSIAERPKVSVRAAQAPSDQVVDLNQ